MTVSMNSNSASVVAWCPAGKVLVGGGYEPATSTNNAVWLVPIQSGPVTATTGEVGWSVTLRNNTTQSRSGVQIRVSALCANQ
jgi:hypothetical protein